jgi:hypothetical protein
MILLLGTALIAFGRIPITALIRIRRTAERTADAERLLRVWQRAGDQDINARGLELLDLRTHLRLRHLRTRRDVAAVAIAEGPNESTDERCSQRPAA